MKIDAHQHFWKYNPQDYSWITDDMAELQRDFLPPDLAPLLTQAGFDGCIAVQAQQTEAETEFLLNLAQQNSIIKGVVGWVDLCAPNINERLAYYSQKTHLKGFRHVVQAEPDDRFLLRPDFRNGISLLKEFNLTYDILIFPRQLPAAVELVTLFPEQPFVLDHIAKPFIKKQELEPWAQHIKELAIHKQVYCKLSGMVTEANWQNWQLADFKIYLDVIFNSFEPDRLMFGSDWPVCLVAGQYPEVIKLVTTYMQEFTEMDQAKILGGNAARFYNLII